MALADGTVFEGRALGFEGETVGEVVFNTAMTGYQEILTDPSYKGQIVTMTSPHIGNYGVTPEDVESARIWAEGFVVKEASQQDSNWRSRQGLHDYLKAAKIVSIEGLDTRALTRHLREYGSQQGCISHLETQSQRAVEKARQAPAMIGRDLAAEVTCKKSYDWIDGSGEWLPVPESNGRDSTRRWKVVAYDFGVKQNILKRLIDVGCDVHVVPASTTASQIEALNPDGIFLSNGPGDPEAVSYAVETMRQLIGSRPIFGICLGHQILGLALGLKTYKLKFGHHGANHPIKDLEHGNVDITTQNHGFAVKAEEKGGEWTLKGNKDVRVTHINLNDQSAAGLRHKKLPVFSVQYHPEAAAGPHDSQHLFDRFLELVEKQ